MSYQLVCCILGDFYLTRHSNLAQVHVVFHLVTDESVGSVNINSRHPIIIGLRNILHTAARHNMTTLTIPLLLVHEMAEVGTLRFDIENHLPTFRSYIEVPSQTQKL